jgi:hypothetical protein
MALQVNHSPKPPLDWEDRQSLAGLMPRRTALLLARYHFA